MNKPLLVASLLAASSIASAQEAALSPIVITASRTTQTVGEALAPVTVITREDIERRQAHDVTDLLRGQPGISISNQGGLGKISAVFLRGTNSDHVLVLIDGIKVGSATSGGFAWQDMPTDQIERIEIVRGPRSSLYGSEAVGGVIQIFTKKGTGSFSPSISYGVGSEGTHQTTASLRAANERGWFNVSASHLETDGFNSCTGSTNAGCFEASPDPDDDGYRRTAASARGGWRFNGGEVELNFLQSQGHNEYDGSSNQSDILQRIAGGQVKLDLTTTWSTRLILGRSWDESDNFYNDTFMDAFNTKRDTASWLNDIAFAKGQMVSFGADFQRDRVGGTTDYDKTSRRNIGGFARYFGEFAAHDVEVAMRHDDDEQFGNHTTGSAAWGYDLNAHLRLLASYGTAFKAPTFNDLYWPAHPTWGGGGNPDLKPERSRTIDIGIQGVFNYGRWSIHAFETKIDDLIAYDFITDSSQNISKARIRGLELATGIKLLSWDTNLALTFIDPESRAEGTYGNQLQRRSQRSARLDLDRNFGALGIGGSLVAASKSYDDLANSRKLGGYGLLDLRAGYAINKDWRVQGKVGNVFDKDYKTASFYNQPGRTWFLSLHYAPKGL